MVILNDYLYSGDTVLRILQKYMQDLRKEAKETHNEIDLAHCNFLIQIMELLEHNDFLTAQSQKIREFYKYMAREYPYLSFTFKGRIKSLIRAEEKFNGYVVEYIYDYYTKYHEYPSVPELKEKLNCFRDLIAYRIVVSMPRCHLKNSSEREPEEIRHLYEIANVLPNFLEERGFTVEPTGGVKESRSPLLSDEVRPWPGIILREKIRVITVPFILPFTITAQGVTWKCSSGRRKWMILQRLVLPIIRRMKSVRRSHVPEEMQSRRENAFTLMKHMSGECFCRG